MFNDVDVSQFNDDKYEHVEKPDGYNRDSITDRNSLCTSNQYYSLKYFVLLDKDIVDSDTNLNDPFNDTLSQIGISMC